MAGLTVALIVAGILISLIVKDTSTQNGELVSNTTFIEALKKPLQSTFSWFKHLSTNLTTANTSPQNEGPDPDTSFIESLKKPVLFTPSWFKQLYTNLTTKDTHITPQNVSFIPTNLTSTATNIEVALKATLLETGTKKEIPDLVDSNVVTEVDREDKLVRSKRFAPLIDDLIINLISREQLIKEKTAKEEQPNSKKM